LKEVVFAPDLIGAAFIDPNARAVLEQWRDGAFRVVVNRELLVLHLKALRELGLGAELIKRWSLWFTSPEKTIFVSDENGSSPGTIELCEKVSRAASGAEIVCWRKATATGGAWVTAEKF
jgi:hypothetical protein